MILFWLPLQMWNQYSPLMTQLRAESEQARTTWEAILAAQPPEDAILVSNDRNEIVPLFYLQSIEGRALQNTGLFPLIAPDDRFRDIGVTLQTALDDGGEQPVYLIKPMVGLEARFALAPRTEPLVEVLGSAATQPPAVAVGQAYGPLYLVGYDWVLTPDELRVDLQWRVDEMLEDDYTTTVQLFDGSGEKIGQDDRQPGGVFYPTSLWKTGERLLDSHVIPVAEGVQPDRLLVGMYAGPDAVLLAPLLELPFPAPSTKAEPDSNG